MEKPARAFSVEENIMIRINSIVLSLDEPWEALRSKAAKALRLSSEDIVSFRILKESIDARGSEVKLSYSVMVETKDDERVLLRARNRDASLYVEEPRASVSYGTEVLHEKPIIVGFGPAGIFCAMTLAKHGYEPVVIERGDDVDKRTAAVDAFMAGGALDTESNIQFGEGGAGAFSDGKLTTRIKDQRVREVMAELIDAGAPAEIAYLSKPHVGTDILKNVVRNMRKKIESLGGEITFRQKLEDIGMDGGRVRSAKVSGRDVPAEALVLAIGHSARDTYEMLFKNGIEMEAKSMAVGARVENLQELIDINQYGKWAGHERLRSSEYKLTRKLSDGRGAYSFCMCPGGFVVPAASEDGRLVVNGMSYHARDGRNANSAIVVSVTPDDYGNHPLDGIRFQRLIEEKAYAAGGGNYTAPVQLVSDFIEGKVSTSLGEVTPTYVPAVSFADIGRLLPDPVTKGLREALTDFNVKIRGFSENGAVLTGVETRTSAPVRVVRSHELQSVSCSGLYLTGEGAGYAGGIVSAAVDGIKAAESIMNRYRPRR